MKRVAPVWRKRLCLVRRLDPIGMTSLSAATPDIVFCSGAAEAMLVTKRPHLRFVTDLGVTVAAALRRVVKSMPLSVEPRG